MTKYVAIICASLLAFNVLLCLALISRAGKTVRETLRSHMLSVSELAASSIDGDVLASLTKDDVGSETYKNIANTLTRLANTEKNTDIKYIYAVKKEGMSYVFTVDPDPVRPAEFGQKVVYSRGLDIAWSGRSYVDDEIITDEWGSFYTAWSPVRNTAGDVIGIVGVDFLPGAYDELRSDIIGYIIFFGVLSILSCGAILFVMIRQMRNQMRSINRELSALSSDMERLAEQIKIKGKSGEEEEKEKEERNEDPSSDMAGMLRKKIHDIQAILQVYMNYAHDQAYTDSMTGVRNTTAYLEKVKEIGERINDGTAAFAVAVFDVNGLKKTNDNYGHECGDRIIIDSSRLIGKVFRDTPIYRIGGDEFIVLLEATKEDELEAKFRGLDEWIERFNAMEKQYAMTLSVSRGGAVYRPGVDADFKEVFRRADENMYANKEEYYRKNGSSRRYDV